MSRYKFIEQTAATEPVQILCRVLEVSAAGYYQWLGQADRLALSWELAANAAFSRHAQRYGTRRLRAELRAEGHAVGRYALRTWLRRCGLRAHHSAVAPVHHRRRPGGYRGGKSVAWPAGVHGPEPSVGWRHYVPAPSRWALVLSGHLAR